MPSDTANRLIEAVLLSIREHGYTGTSMQNLLRETGVSSSSMYHFFPGGKEALVAAAVRKSGLRSAEQIAEVLARHPFAEGIELIFGASAKDMEAKGYRLGCPIGVPATEIAADSEAIQEAVVEVFAAWTAAYTEALRAEGLADERAEMLGRFIVATFEGAATLARATHSIQPYRDASAIITAHLAHPD